MAMQRDMRLFLGSLAFAVALSCLGLAYPDMSRFITVPLAIVALCFALYFLLPELRGIKLGAHKTKLLIGALVCTTLIVGFAGYSAWHFERRSAFEAKSSAASADASSNAAPAAPQVQFVSGFSSATGMPAQAKISNQSMQPPSLLSLYMTDFTSFGGDGATVTVQNYNDLKYSDQTLRVFFQVIGTVASRSTFLAVYIPPTHHTFDAIYAVSLNYKSYLTFMPPITAQAQGDPSITNLQSLVFTGRIFIYYETPLTLAQLGALDSILTQRGLYADFRGADYALTALDSIKQGNMKPPQVFQIVNGLPKAVKDPQASLPVIPRPQ